MPGFRIPRKPTDMGGGSDEKNRGGGRGGGGPYQRASSLDGRLRAPGTDRYCTSCGGIIKGFAFSLLANCPHKECGEVVQYNTGVGEDFDENGWGRCRNCKSFLHRNHVYCQSCCYLNRIGKERKDRIRVQRLKKEAAQNKKEREEKDAKIARLEADLLELSQIVERRESQGRTLELNSTLDDEEENNLLSQVKITQDGKASELEGSKIGENGTASTSPPPPNEEDEV